MRGLLGVKPEVPNAFIDVRLSPINCTLYLRLLSSLNAAYEACNSRPGQGMAEMIKANILG